MAGPCEYDQPAESEVVRLYREIAEHEATITKKKAYLEFLKAHPEFNEYHRLKNEAR